MGARQGEIEKEDSADEFTTHGDEVVANAVGNAVDERKTKVAIVEISVWVRGLGEGNGKATTLKRLLSEVSDYYM